LFGKPLPGVDQDGRLEVGPDEGAVLRDYDEGVYIEVGDGLGCEFGQFRLADVDRVVGDDDPGIHEEKGEIARFGGLQPHHETALGPGYQDESAAVLKPDNRLGEGDDLAGIQIDGAEA